MNYESELLKIEDFIASGYCSEAVRNCGIVLESALKDIYRRIKSDAPIEIAKKLIDIE